jgi:hypothetical protein
LTNDLTENGIDIPLNTVEQSTIVNDNVIVSDINKSSNISAVSKTDENDVKFNINNIFVWNTTRPRPTDLEATECFIKIVKNDEI